MEDKELPVPEGYDEEGLDALYELAAGDVVRVVTEDGETEVKLARESGFDDAGHRVLWSRMAADGERALAVVTGDDTYLFEDPEQMADAHSVETLEVVETGDAVVCELHPVHYPDGDNSSREDTAYVRAPDLETAKEQYEERHGTVDYFAAGYEDVRSQMEIVAAEEGLVEE